MKFAIVIPCQKFYPATLELFLALVRQKMLENTIKIHCLSFDLVKIWCEGKFERLITKTNLDRRLAMILARK